MTAIEEEKGWLRVPGAGLAARLGLTTAHAWILGRFAGAFVISSLVTGTMEGTGAGGVMEEDPERGILPVGVEDRAVMVGVEDKGGGLGMGPKRRPSGT